VESRCVPGVGAGAFPLTPALSRRERGNRVQSLANPTLQPGSQAEPVPPSPWGEGRGEGENNVAPGPAQSGSTIHPISCCSPIPAYGSGVLRLKQELPNQRGQRLAGLGTPPLGDRGQTENCGEGGSNSRFGLVISGRVRVPGLQPHKTALACRPGALTRRGVAIERIAGFQLPFVGRSVSFARSLIE
jgi:hypothetical protein